MVQTAPLSPYKSRSGLRRIFRALGYSLQGIKAALRYESAFRLELTLAVIMVPLAFWLGRSLLEVFLLIFTVIMVLVIELINSALEALADALSLETHPLLGRAKDLGSAAVLLMLLLVFALWGTVAINRFLM